MQNHTSKYPSTFYRVSLKAIIKNDKGEVLVVKEDDSTTWSLPGGGWDHGETEQEALARELHEEVGYKGEFTSKTVTTEIFWLESRQAWLLWIVYEVATANQDFSVGESCSEVAFVHPSTFQDSPHRVEQWIYNFLK